MNATRLLERLDEKRLVPLVAAALPAISREGSPYRFEGVLTVERWASVSAIAGPSIARYLAARRRSDGRLFLTVLEAVLRPKAGLAQVANRFLADAAPSFLAAIKYDKLPPFPSIANAIADRLSKGEEPEEVRFRGWARSKLKLLSSSLGKEELALLRAAVDASLVAEFLSNASLPAFRDWYRQGLLSRAAAAAPDVIVPALRRFWYERVDWDGASSDLSGVLAQAVNGAPLPMLAGSRPNWRLRRRGSTKKSPRLILTRWFGDTSTTSSRISRRRFPLRFSTRRSSGRWCGV